MSSSSSWLSSWALRVVDLPVGADLLPLRALLEKNLLVWRHVRCISWSGIGVALVVFVVSLTALSGEKEVSSVAVRPFGEGQGCFAMADPEAFAQTLIDYRNGPVSREFTSVVEKWLSSGDEPEFGAGPPFVFEATGNPK